MPSDITNDLAVEEYWKNDRNQLKPFSDEFMLSHHMKIYFFSNYIIRGQF